MKNRWIPILYAFLAAVFYAINTPLSKLLLDQIPTTFMASFLYLGAGAGVGVMYLFHWSHEEKTERLTQQNLPYTIGMIALDILAPISLMMGIQYGTAANASLLGNFEIVVLKGIFSGGGAFIIALLLGEKLPKPTLILSAMLLGYVAYGLSIFLYIRAQRDLGAAKTSAYYAAAPFVGALLSFVLINETLTWIYFVALVIMIVGTVFVVMDTIARHHLHQHTHTFTHTHDGSTHTHTFTHSHEHDHYVALDKHEHHHRKKELEAAAGHTHM